MIDMTNSEKTQEGKRMIEIRKMSLIEVQRMLNVSAYDGEME